MKYTWIDKLITRTRLLPAVAVGLLFLCVCMPTQAPAQEEASDAPPTPTTTTDSTDERNISNNAVLREEGKTGPMFPVNDLDSLPGIRDEDLIQSSTTDPELQDGDTVEIFVSEDPSFNGVYTVSRGGYVIIPQVGHFKVGGMTIKQAEATLKARLEKDLLRNATTSIILTSSTTTTDGKTTGYIYVIGEVQSPGIVRVPPNERLTILTAILRAGGLDEYADSANIQLARLESGRRKVSVMDFDAVLTGHAKGTELFLQSGDIVNVPSRDRFDPNKPPPPNKGTVYLSGQVKDPGPHEIRDNTVYRTILRYGGFDRFANLKKSYVLRMENDVQIKIPVNIHKIIKTGALDLDIQVKPGDIIVVPEKFFSF